MLPLRLTRRPDTHVLTTAALLLAAAFGGGLVMPLLFWAALAAGVLGGVLFLAYRHPAGFCVAWLLVTGMTLEMALNDFGGPALYQPAIAVVKATGIGLAVVCAARYGPRFDGFNPAWAYLGMLAAGLAHGLYPGLSTADSVRSCIGSVAPFAFCFCRPPRAWQDAIIRATAWCPAVAVAACVPLALAGLRPLFVDSGGARLAGLGHPAFLAGVCLPAVYACLVLLYRHGRSGALGLLAVNFVILLLTGARAPLAYAVAVTFLCLVSIRSTVFPARWRVLLCLAGAAVVLALLPFVADMTDIRLFNVLTNAADNLSGRGLLWPPFEDAAAQSPWFGWGVGAGNVIIPPHGPIARLLQTRAAHNEYLRIQVEGGQIGLAALIALFAAWVFVHTRRLGPSDRRIMRFAFLALAGHAVTDNILISTPACVFFAFTAAVFADAHRLAPRLALNAPPQVA
jgi:O-antigen ligase